jgi:hypothetical protein
MAVSKADREELRSGCDTQRDAEWRRKSARYPYKTRLLVSREAAKANYPGNSHFLFRHSPAHRPDGFNGSKKVPV